MKTPIKRPTKKTLEQKFTLHAPGAQSVLLAADFTDWQQHALSMKASLDGKWIATVALPPGTYHYRFMVDGQWCDDPECTLRAPNPYGSHNMVRMVPQTRQKPARAASIPITRREAHWPGWKPTNTVQSELSRPRISAL